MLFARLSLCIAVVFGAAASVRARDLACQANLAGQILTLHFDSASVRYRSLREHWSPLAPNCPSEAVIAALKPDVPPEGRGAYCLLSDEKSGATLAAVLGRGDRFGRCRAEGLVCRAVNGAKDYALAAAADIGHTILGSTRALTAAGLSAVENNPGTVILTGTSGSVAGTFAAGASTAVKIATAPQTLTGAAAGAVVLGGALLICGS